MIFDHSDVNWTLDEISRELVQTLPLELNDPYTPDKPWTKAVKDTLSQMGSQRGMYVCCHGSPHQGEWLLDVIWMLTSQHRIILAVESEWGNQKAIQEDFDKLLSIKAKHKLFLFSTKNHKGADAIITCLESDMRAFPYHLEGEEYMVLEVTAPGAFRYYFEVPKNGRLENIRFTESETLRWPWA